MELSVRISTLCRDNGGAISAAITKEHGISERSLLRRWHSGQLTRLLPGVFCPAGMPLTHDLKVAAAALWLPDGVLCDGTALWMWGATGPTDRIDIACTGARRSPATWLRTRKVTDHIDLDIREVNGFRVTSPARTLMDASRFLTSDQVQDALDELWRLGKVTPRQIERRCTRSGRTRRGTSALLSMARDRLGTAPTDSHLEDRVVRLIRRWRIKQPLRQSVVRDAAGERIGRMDLVYPEERVIIECDSRQHHLGARFDSDRTKWNRAENAGYRLQWATWRNTAGEGRGFIAELRQKLEEGSNQLPLSGS